MTVAMTKYRLEDKYYLVYEQNMLGREFTPEQWRIIADSEQGIGADYIIVVSGGNMYFYSKYGMRISENAALKSIAALYFQQSLTCALPVARNIEVRFTESYINRICSGFKQDERKAIA